MSTEVTSVVFFTAAASMICAFCALMIAEIIKQVCYWKLVRVFYKEHREEWLQEGKPDHVLLEGSLTGGRYRGSEQLLSKWLYSSPAWISTSEDLGRIHRRMCRWDRIAKRIIIGLILVVLLGLNSLVFAFGRMKKGEQSVPSSGSMPPSVNPSSPVGGSEG